ncbi:MAG: hypothetical protein ACYC7E_14540 [Armatimonadota bacterium]
MTDHSPLEIALLRNKAIKTRPKIQAMVNEAFAVSIPVSSFLDVPSTLQWAQKVRHVFLQPPDPFIWEAWFHNALEELGNTLKEAIDNTTEYQMILLIEAMGGNGFYEALSLPIGSTLYHPEVFLHNSNHDFYICSDNLMHGCYFGPDSIVDIWTVRRGTPPKSGIRNYLDYLFVEEGVIDLRAWGNCANRDN